VPHRRLALTLAATLAAALTLAACHSDRAKDAAVTAGPAEDAEILPPPPPVDAATTPLVTGKFANPTVLTSQNVGSLPVNLIPSSDGKYVISTDAGYRQALWVTRVADGQGVSHLLYNNKRIKTATTQEKSQGLYYGLATAGDTVYAAQGGHDTIAVLKLSGDGQLTRERIIATKKSDFPAGLAIDGSNRLYVANNDPVAFPPVFQPSSVAIYDAASGKELGRHAFADSFGGTPNFPLAVAVTRDGTRCFVASERDAAVYALDTSDPANIKQIAKIDTGANPVALRLSKDESRLFVANAGSDTVSFVDAKTNAVTATTLLRPDIARSLAGATPTGLALSSNEKFLYVTLGDMNAVAVVDVPDRELEGYIPAGWYPTAAVCATDGKSLMVANGKGTNVRYPNPPADWKPRPPRPGARAATTRTQQSPNNLIEGTVATIAIPSKEELNKLTEQVLEQNRLTPKYLQQANPLQSISLAAGKIKHVIYVVKENRTYDQVLGDVKGGNGDTKYTIFGEKITPNQHAIARRFVLMDNFYDSGEVSGDGWTWSTQAMANEYTIRNVPYQYSERGRKFDYEGTNNEWPTGGFPATGPDGKPLSDHPAFKEGMKPFPDVAEAPGGHLWDLARKHNLSYRNYGMFVSNGVKSKDGKQTIVPDNYPASTGVQPAGRDLSGITNVDFRRFDTEYPDSDAARMYFEKTQDKKFLWKKTKFGMYDAPSRFSAWKREFDQMLAKDPTGNAVPNLMTVRFCTDHTAGANPGFKSPKAMVADNDYAVGQLVEAVSHSPVWDSTAIFILEDDAQNGPDHIDAHRSTCYAISPFIKQGSIDHNFHSTASCLRTIELLLNLPPMCQYDAIAAPLGVWDTTPSNNAPFTATLPDAKVMIDTNPAANEVKPISPEQVSLIEESLKMDFSVADRAPADKLNEIIWKMSKGFDSKLPPTPNGIAGVTMPKQKDDDDD
jgi:DNA-binding beta-propeller fold protein YncE